MINIYNKSFIDLLPSSIKNDETVKSFAAAVDEQLRQVSKDIAETVIIPRINELPEELVDLLAWQFHVDFYEPLGGIDLDKKRTLVERSISWHRRKGTKAMLEEVIRILFFEEFYIEEWYEYGGEPYFFSLVIHDFIKDEEQYRDLIQAVYELKNVRSWLERIKLYHDADTTVYFGNLTKNKVSFFVDRQELINEIKSANIYLGNVTKNKRNYKIGMTVNPTQVKPIDINVGIVSRNRKKFKIDTNVRLAEFESVTANAGIISSSKRKFVVG